MRGKINVDIIEDLYVFMCNIRGIFIYWRNEFLNLFVRIGILGLVIWFIILLVVDL